MKNYNLTDMALWFVFLASIFLNNCGLSSQADNPTFVSIDCGLPENSTYKDVNSTLTYSSDEQYIDTGTNHNISGGYITPELSPHYLNVRSFDTGIRNCYTIKPLVVKEKYLVRATFMYGNYDGLNKGPIFDLHIGVNYWKTVNISDPGKFIITEVMFVTPVDYIHVCLVNIGLGTPFISSLDLRPMKSILYPYADSSQALSLKRRLNAGPTDTKIIRYPDDPYDRMWEPWSLVGYWTEINTTSRIQNLEGDIFEVPSAVMQTAVTPVNSSEPLRFHWEDDPPAKNPGYLLNLHFAELIKLTKNETRKFNITLNNTMWYNESYSPGYLYSDAIYGLRSISGLKQYNVNLTATESSLPPILNALELFIALPVSDVPTDSVDVSAINAIKLRYQIKRNWNGDPCASKTYAWDGLDCKYVVFGSPRITSLSLASSGLTGEITNAFANLKELQTLDLSHNNLTGSIPDVLSQLPSLTLLDLTGNQLSGSIPSVLLKKSQDGSLILRVADNAKLCSNETSCNFSKKKSNNSKIVIAIIVSIVVVAILAAVGAFVIYKFKRQPGPSMNTTINLQNTGYSTGTSTVDNFIHFENRQFTYNDLKLITNNFQREIGRGGFGIVYSGFIEGTQVAVKLWPQTSTQGVKEFMVEAQHLTRIHHKNLASLIGYCKDENSLALVLEYMSEGNLHDHLIGERAGRTQLLTWRDRIRIALESAQGLEYLHKGCNPPLIHRDVKPNNILLNAKLEAKIADFGMSKAFGNTTNTHVSTNNLIGTPGYVDPEHHMTFRLTEKSDVYSFGVVLLQILTGQPAIIQGPGPKNESMHIIQWVQQMLAKGNIESIVDARIKGEYDINSIWKAADVALKCTAQTAQRPTMTEVVMQLKECIELEAATGRNYNTNLNSGNSSYGIPMSAY